MEQMWQGCEVSKYQGTWSIKLKQGCEIKKKKRVCRVKCETSVAGVRG